MCSCMPMTGYFRDGYCRTGGGDRGVHCVCAIVDRAFLNYTKARGNDLETPRPERHFPGLRPGDRWCLCVERWKEAHSDGCAPKVILESTSESALEFVDLADLKQHEYVS